MALMTMSVLLIIALSFSYLVISDIKQAKLSDNAIVAYYAADAGVERTLFLFRKQDKENMAEIAVKAGDLDLASWNISSSNDYEKEVVRQRLYNGQGFKLYFLNRPVGKINQAKTLVVDWSAPVATAGEKKLQVTFTKLDFEEKPLSGGGSIWVNETDASVPIAAGFHCFEFASDNKNYVVDFKALGSNGDLIVENINVRAYDVPDCSMFSDPDLLNNSLSDAISNIQIRSIGSYRNATQEITAAIPPRDPISGLLGFVLFSEQSIEKSY